MLKKYLAILLAAPVIIQSWHTYTATRDTVSLWLYSYTYVVKDNSSQVKQTDAHRQKNQKKDAKPDKVGKTSR